MRNDWTKKEMWHVKDPSTPSGACEKEGGALRAYFCAEMLFGYFFIGASQSEPRRDPN